MSNIQTGAERMPHDLSHLGFLAGQIGRLITISTTPVIAGDSFEMDAVGALRLSPLRRGLAIDSTVDIFTFYVPHRHVYGEQWIKFMKDGVNATPLPTVNTTGYIDHAAFLGTINPDTNKIPKHLFQGYLNIYNNYFKAPRCPSVRWACAMDPPACVPNRRARHERGCPQSDDRSRSHHCLERRPRRIQPGDHGTRRDDMHADQSRMPPMSSRESMPRAG